MTDLVLFLGISIIGTLNLRRHARIALFANAGVGSVSIVMVGIRFFVVYEAALRVAHDGIFLTLYYSMAGFSLLEVMLAFAGFCFPSFVVLWDRWRGTPDYRKGYTDTRGSETLPGSTRPALAIMVEDTIELVHEDRDERELS